MWKVWNECQESEVKEVANNTGREVNSITIDANYKALIRNSFRWTHILLDPSVSDMTKAYH